jgi:galactitol-specific phosphotransferase system IIC component
MASWWKGDIVSGLAIGLGSAIVAPLVIPALSKTVRPLMKAAIKGGLVLWKTGKEKLAEVCELADDLLAEAKAEIASEKPPVAGRGEKLK